MRTNVVDIFGSDGEFFPRLEQTLDWSAALKAYVDARWPVGRRKGVIAAWRLSEDEARSVVDGKASKATIAKIFHKDRGGWPVALAITSAVVGLSLDHHLQTQRARHAQLTRRHNDLLRDLRSGPGGGGMRPG